MVTGFISRLEMKAKQHIIGVCVKGVGEGNEVSGDYYGILHEIIHAEFTGEPIKKRVLFNC